MTSPSPEKPGGLPRLLVICFSNLRRDPRVLRALRALGGEWRITAAGFADPGIEGVDFIPVEPYRPRSLPGKLASAALLRLAPEAQYWSGRPARSARAALANSRAEAILANDLDTLPLATELGRAWGVPVVYDAHEFSPGEHSGFVFRHFHRPARIRLLKRHLPRTAAMITVGEGIARAYERDFGVACSVVRNAPARQSLSPSAPQAGTVRMVHHGAAWPQRGLETMIDLMGHLDPRFSLTFMLVPSDPAYMESLRARAAHDPRIRFVDPVPVEAIVGALNPYDLGLYCLRPTNFNNSMALPNKFFEFIQARLGLALWPSPEMAALARRHDLGVVSPEFSIESLAGALNALAPEDIARFKANADAASGLLCAEREMETLRRILREALAGGPACA